MATIVSDTTETSPDGSTIETIIYSDTSRSVRYVPGPGTPQADAVSIQTKVTTALTANANDLTQDAAIITQAATVTGSTGTLSTAQLSTIVRSLAQAVSILAANDENTKTELGYLIRLALGLFDSD